jgi:cob(I)alamin adenosyltransferase
MSIVTKSGDAGSTALMYGRRVPKTDPRVEAYGTVDELNAALGLAVALAARMRLGQDLRGLQRNLVALMGELATHPRDLPRYLRGGYARIGPEHTARVERLVRKAESGLGPLTGWAMPGQSLRSAALDLARTVCRRAERRVCALLGRGQLRNREILVYLNRLSDLLWLLARAADKGNVRAGRRAARRSLHGAGAPRRKPGTVRRPHGGTT